MPFDLSDPRTMMWFIASIPVAWLVGTVLFLMGCALADVPEIRFPRALLVAGLGLVVSVPLGWFIFSCFDKLDSSTEVFSSMRLLGILLAVLAFWIVSAVLFRVMQAAPTIKAFLVSLYELLLGTLLSALVLGVVFVVMAFRQATSKPPAPQPKAWLNPPAPGWVQRT